MVGRPNMLDPLCIKDHITQSAYFNPGEHGTTERYPSQRSAPSAERRAVCRNRRRVVGQFSNILNHVEDEWTTIPCNPASWAEDGRLYPPQSDNARAVPGHPHVTRYRSLGHNTFVGANGSIEIRRVDGSIEFQKAGADGRYVWDLN